MLILVIPYIIALSQSMSVMAAYGTGKHKFLSLVTIGEGVFNLCLSITLVRHYGIYGVAIGTAIPMFIVKVFIQPVYICRVVGLPVMEYAGKLLRSFLMGALYIAMAKGVTSMFHLDSYIRLFLSVSVSFLFFMTFAVIFCLNDNERTNGRQWIARRVSEKIS